MLQVGGAKTETPCLDTWLAKSIYTLYEGPNDHF